MAIGVELAQNLRGIGIDRAFASPPNSTESSDIVAVGPNAEEVASAKTNLNSLFDMQVAFKIFSWSHEVFLFFVKIQISFPLLLALDSKTFCGLQG